MCLLALYVALLAWVWALKVDLLDNPAYLEMTDFERLDIEAQVAHMRAKASFAASA
jgi:hypothetical protein